MGNQYLINLIYIISDMRKSDLEMKQIKDKGD